VIGSKAPIHRPHTFRTLQQLLGHFSIRTTVRYTQVSTRQIEQTRSPLDNLDLPPEPESE
jgi:hypothetical protein